MAVTWYALLGDREARTAAELERRRDDVLLSGTGKDESTAFRAWRIVSCLTDEEALRRWRRVFAAPDGEESLEGDRPRRAAQR